ncbi:hypothetical protein HIM_03030 [Hirsutella minnesotensis 3608]|nr:hypothetical protein HIM_03030 [Hirsutella minnesotensis 3608]
MNSSVIFEFQSQTLCGRGGPVSFPPYFYFQNVVRLVLEGGNLQGLPQNIVLKKKDAENEPLFETEQRFYEKLQHLQGRVIPRYYGLASVDGTPALVLSDVGGIMMLDEKMPSLAESCLREKLREPLEEIRAAGVLLEDVSLTNIHYCSDGVFRVLDFELVKMDQPVDDVIVKEDVGLQVESIVERYQERQAAIRELDSLWKHRSLINCWKFSQRSE